jgi:hypothetical protein
MRREKTDMSFEFFLGVFLLVLGIVSLIGRIFTIERLFWKLDKMKAFWGDKRGTIIHFVGYTIVPIVVGTILILTPR